MTCPPSSLADLGLHAAEPGVAQVTVLADSGRRPEACQVLRTSRGRATSAGADQLDARLRGMESQVCQ